MEQFTSELRLGDVIDDHCIKCRRVTNHSIVSLVEGKAAKVRCRTCYHDHDYRNEQAPPTKKELLQQALFKEVLAGVTPSGDAKTVDDLAAIGDDPDAIAAALSVDGPETDDAMDADEPLAADEPVAEVSPPAAAPRKKAKARTKRA
jgi:hypothetical protein